MHFISALNASKLMNIKVVQYVYIAAFIRYTKQIANLIETGSCIHTWLIFEQTKPKRPDEQKGEVKQKQKSSFVITRIAGLVHKRMQARDWELASLINLCNMPAYDGIPLEAAF